MPFLVTLVPVDRRRHGDPVESIPIFFGKALDLAAAAASSSAGWARRRGQTNIYFVEVPNRYWPCFLSKLGI
jgi:hypothetical protein